MIIETTSDVMFPLFGFATVTGLFANQFRGRSFLPWFFIGLLFAPAGPLIAVGRRCRHCGRWVIGPLTWVCPWCVSRQNYPTSSDSESRWQLVCHRRAKKGAAAFIYISQLIITAIWIAMPVIERHDIRFLKLVFVVAALPAMSIERPTFIVYCAIFFLSPAFWGGVGYMCVYVFNRELRKS